MPTRPRRSRIEKPLRRRMLLEPLEHRCLLAVLNVGPGAGFATVQEAVNNARGGDVVLIAEGNYSESVNLSRMGEAVGGQVGALTIRGESTNAIISSPGGPALFNSEPFRGDLELEDFTLRAPASTAQSDSGIYLEDFQGGLTINAINVEDTIDQGIHVGRLNGSLSIENNTITNAGNGTGDHGIVLQQVSATGSIGNNTITDARDVGIVIENSLNTALSLAIENNQIEGDASFATTNEGIRITAGGDSRLSLRMTDNNFSSLDQNMLDVTLTGSAEMFLQFSDSLLSDGDQGGARIAVEGQATLTLEANRNEVEGLRGKAIEVTLRDFANLHAKLENNIVISDNAETAVHLEATGESRATWAYAENEITDTLGDAMLIKATGLSRISATLRENQFVFIGDGVNDDALTITSDAGSHAVINANIFDNEFTTVTGIGLHVAGYGASDYSIRVFDNTFDDINLANGSAAVLVDKAVSSSSADIDLILAENLVQSLEAAAYRLLQVGTGQFRLEGTLATASEQIASANSGEPVEVQGNVEVVAPDAFAFAIPVSLGGQIWRDIDGDGVRAQDGSEDGIGKITVSIAGTPTATGETISVTTLTDENGMYQFGALLPGDYMVTAAVPAGFQLSPRNQGGDDSLDSDFDRATTQVQVTLAPLTDLLSVDAGIVGTWQNPANPLDVNVDKFVSPLDALVIINKLERDGPTVLPVPPTNDGSPPTFYFDTNADGFVSPIDALLVINFIIGGTQQEGESAGPLPPVSVIGESDVISTRFQRPTEAGCHKSSDSWRPTFGRCPLPSHRPAETGDASQASPKRAGSRLTTSEAWEDLLADLALDATIARQS